MGVCHPQELSWPLQAEHLDTVLMFVASLLLTNPLKLTDLEVACYSKKVATFDPCCLVRTGWSI